MRAAAAAVLAACAIAAGGCTAIRVSKVGKTMVEVENNGWLLFNFIPIASGDTDSPDSHWCKLFQNSVSLDNNIDLLDQAVRREGAIGVRDVISYTTDEHVLIILLKRHSMHTSAELVMPGDDSVGEVHKIEPKKLRGPELVEVNTVRKDPPAARERANPGPTPGKVPEPERYKLLEF